MTTNELVKLSTWTSPFEYTPPREIRIAFITVDGTLHLGAYWPWGQTSSLDRKYWSIDRPHEPLTLEYHSNIQMLQEEEVLLYRVLEETNLTEEVIRSLSRGLDA